MKLRGENKELNRRFHELAEEERIEFLLDGYQQTFSDKGGEFTPMEVTPEIAARDLTNEERGDFSDTINNLNFFMTRLNMEGRYESLVEDLCLLYWEYIFFAGDTEQVQDIELVAEFFEKRNKLEYIKPVFERMGERALDYNFLAEKIIAHPLFEKHVGRETATYKFRARIHDLVDGYDFSKDQTAAALAKDGFDLNARDFNKWYAVEKDWDLRRSQDNYEESEEERKWLEDFIGGNKANEDESLCDNELASKIVEEENEEPSAISYATIEELDTRAKNTLKEKGEETPIWIKSLIDLTTDHDQLNINASSQVQAKVWEYLWSGSFRDLMYQLKGANPDGETRNGLEYVLWALKQEEHAAKLSTTLAEDAYAMIIAGDILVGSLGAAVDNFNEEDLQKFKNEKKLKAAINIAWELWQHPGQSDEAEDYQPPGNYCFALVKEFENYLSEVPSAQPYLRILDAKELGEEEIRIVDGITDLDVVENVFANDKSEIKTRYLKVFDETFDNETEFCSIYTDLRRTVSLVENPQFRKHVNEGDLKSKLQDCVERTLKRKNRHDEARDALGTRRLVLSMCQNPVIGSYLEGKVDLAKNIEGMIDEIIGWRRDLLEKPLSLRNSGEVVPIMGMGEIVEAYVIADRNREKINPEKMQDLVAYLLALGSDRSVSGSYFALCEKGDMKEEDRPEYFPSLDTEGSKQMLEFLSNVYQREKQRGGLDKEKASIGVSNIIFRGTYVSPRRFYPHIDSMLEYLDSPLAELLPDEGLGADGIKEYRILKEFIEK